MKFFKKIPHSTPVVLLFAVLSPVLCQNVHVQSMVSNADIQNKSTSLPCSRLTKRSLQHDEFQRDLAERVHGLPISKLNRYKLEAAMHLQSNLERSFRILANSVDKVPAGVRTMAKKALIVTHSGRLSHAIVRNIGVILRKASQHHGHPAEQLQTILTTIVPHVPVGARNHLQGILGFVSSNLSIVNTLLARVLGTVPNLLAGVINSLTTNLGAVTEAVSGTLGTLGILLGGILG